MGNKDFADYTVRELTAMGYEVIVKHEPTGNSTGVHMHIPEKIIKVSDKDYQQILDSIIKPAKASSRLRKLFGGR